MPIPSVNRPAGDQADRHGSLREQHRVLILDGQHTRPDLNRVDLPECDRQHRQQIGLVGHLRCPYTPEPLVSQQREFIDELVDRRTGRGRH